VRFGFELFYFGLYAIIDVGLLLGSQFELWVDFFIHPFENQFLDCVPIAAFWTNTIWV
jgi:hypothetical protein